MTTFTDVFGGANIYPSEISYSTLTLVEDVFLSWPEETSAAENLATRIIDIVGTLPSLSIYVPSAAKTGVGQTMLINNQGSQIVLVKDATGTQIVSLVPGSIWQIYLIDNSTNAGVWVALQFGSTVSNATASQLAGTGIVATGTLLSQSIPITEFNSDYTAGTGDRARMFLWTGSSGTLTLPVANTVGNNWFILLRNSGTGQISLDPIGGVMIDGAASLAFQPGESAFIATDGIAFYTVGYGQSSTFAFDYTSIAVPGAGNYVLSGSELNRIAYNFTGVLTADRTVIVPATVQQYWISNATTGAFQFEIKTASGTGQLLASGERAIFYCDGVNVVDADSSTASFPILISQGGTGAITASAARINLGGTAVGIGIFTAADANAAWAALGTIPLVSGGAF